MSKRRSKQLKRQHRVVSHGQNQATSVGGGVGSLNAAGRDHLTINADNLTIQHGASIEMVIERERKIMELESEIARLRAEKEQQQIDNQKELDALRTELNLYQSKEVQNLSQVADDAYNSGNWQIALNALNTFIDMIPTNENALVKRALIHYFLNDYERAAKDAHTVLNANPNNSLAYHLLGAIAMRKLDFVAAQDYIDKALLIEPTNHEFIANRGIVHYALGNNQEALSCFDQALALEPKYAFALTHRGKIYEELGIHDKASDDFRKALLTEHTGVEDYRAHARSLFMTGDIQGAIIQMRHYTKGFPFDPNAHNDLAFLLLLGGKVSAAEAAWNQATSLNNANSHVYAGHAVALYRLGKTRASQSKFREAIRQEPGWKNDLENIAKKHSWTEDMIATAREILTLLEQ